MYQCTQKKLQFLREKGCNVIAIWKCEWAQIKKRERMWTARHRAALGAMGRFLLRSDRCGEIVLLGRRIPGRANEYYDFMSLKPFVNKNSRNPACHPEIISQSGHTDISCMLPREQNRTVTFPLCATCVEEEMEKPILKWSHYCAHMDQQHQIINTWCAPEMEKAVEKGHEII